MEQLISEVGFPIACVIGLAYFIKQMIVYVKDVINKIIDQFIEANDKLLQTNGEILESNKKLVESNELLAKDVVSRVEDMGLKLDLLIKEKGAI